jgi:proteasome lid subunit RPN8/RPN11
MELAISRALLDEMKAHASEDAEREVCGLLLGRRGRVERIVRCANVAPDPRRHFELDPTALIAAHRAGREGGLRPIGHYHSHPSGQAVPSAHDAKMAEPGSYWVIIADGELTCWLFQTGGPEKPDFAPVMIC